MPVDGVDFYGEVLSRFLPASSATVTTVHAVADRDDEGVTFARRHAD